MKTTLESCFEVFPYPQVEYFFHSGSSINDVTVLGGHGFCDNSTKVSVIKSVNMRGGGQKMSPPFPYLANFHCQFGTFPLKPTDFFGNESLFVFI